MRIRSIKPGAFKSETLAELPVDVRWTYAGLWCYVDDEGRGPANPRLVKADLYPLDDDYTADVVEDHLKQIESKGKICRYQVGGRQYLHVVTFSVHQHPNRPTPSKHPPCPHPHPVDGEDSDEEQGGLTEDSGSRQGAKAQPPASRDPNEGREDVESLCVYLADQVVAQDGSRRPKITKKWRDEARRLLDTDKIPEAEIKRIIDFSQADSFWRQNILSMPKLREQFDKLRRKANAAGSGAASTNGRYRPGSGSDVPPRDTYTAEEFV